MTDRIFVKNLAIHGFHGVLPEETRLGQTFYLDIECRLDLTACAAQDDYELTVCYDTLTKLAAEISDAGPYQLIETLGDRVARAALARFSKIEEIMVQVRKPSAPIKAHVDYVAIEVHRAREIDVAFSLGSNVGEKDTNILRAVSLLGAELGLELDHFSHVYQTPPWGKTDQEWFLNACVTGRTKLSPDQLLKRCKAIEAQIGRTPGIRWGPRVIDIDLLYAGELEIQNPNLTLPHPDLLNRAFVLTPLADVAPDKIIQGQTIRQALAKLGDANDGIERVETAGHRPIING